MFLACWGACFAGIIYTSTGATLSFGSIVNALPWIFIILPLIVLVQPNYLGYLLILFLPLQQIFLCLAYTHNPDWGYAMKWVLGWKDYCVGVVLSIIFFKYGKRMRPNENWEYYIFLYFTFLILMLILRGNYPLMSRVSSLRFYIAPFLFFLCGFYLIISTRRLLILINLFFMIVIVIFLFGIIEVSLFSDDFFLKYIDIGGFKTGVHKTAITHHIGTYLYAPGFLHQRRMNSIFLASPASGHFLSFALCLFLALRHTEVGFQNQVLSFCMIGLMAAGVMLTFNRLSVLEIGAVGIYFTYKADLKKRRLYLFMGGLALICLSAYSGQIFKVATATLTAKDASSAKHLNAILDVPLNPFGKGLGATANVFTDAEEDGSPKGEGVYNRMLIETGLIGLGLFILIYAAIIKTAYKGSQIKLPDCQSNQTYRLAKGICTMGLVYCIIMIPSIFITVNMFSSVSHGFFWFSLGLGFRLHRNVTIST